MHISPKAGVTRLREILNSFRDGGAARTAFERSKLRKTAKSRRHTSEPHRPATIRATQRFVGCVHLQSVLQRLEVRDHIRCLARVELKLRHIRVSRANALDECFLEAFDRIPQVQLTKRRRNFERTRAHPIGRVAIAAVCSNKSLTSLFAGRHLRSRNARQYQVKRHDKIGQPRDHSAITSPSASIVMPTNGVSQSQAFKRRSAARLRSTIRRELGSAIAALFSRIVNVRETVSMVSPR